MKRAAQKKNYLEVSYNKEKLPLTSYPKKLATYIQGKFFSKKDHASFIDIGCGRGEFLTGFDELGFKVTGVDVSPAIHDLSHRFSVSQCDFENEPLSYPDNSFDFLLCKSVVEHLHYPEKLMDECFRILKPGGKAVFMCPSWIHTYWGPFYIDHTHVTPFTLPSLTQLLELSGFNVTYADHFVQLPILWKMPFLKILSDITALLPFRFRPLYKSSLPESVNKWVRFSKEKMLLVVGEKK
ncbi:MAG: class I SAM-dependent methyltransferase [Alphaproteobacteria bacterium]|nr:class I SAM-dependent methyltransferase [Alphaproteobacteria bacterium]